MAGFAIISLVSILVGALLGAVWFVADSTLAVAQQPDPVEINIQERINLTDSPQALGSITLTIQEVVVVAEDIATGQGLTFREGREEGEGEAGEEGREEGGGEAGEEGREEGGGEAGEEGRESSNGRGLIGRVVSIDRDAIVVHVLGQDIRVLLSRDTGFWLPSDFNAGIDDILLDPPERVAIVTDGPAGSGTSTARFVTMIPSQATRAHQRVVAAEIRADGFTAADRQGNISLVAGGRGIESGDSLVLLVQGEQSGTSQRRQRLLTPASSVFDRLNLMAESQPADSDRSLELLKLRLQNQEDEENALLETRDRSASEYGSSLDKALGRSSQNRGEIRKDSSTLSDFNPAQIECIFHVLGFIPKDESHLSTEELALINEKCPADNEPPTIRIVSTDALDSVEPETVIVLTAETSDDGYIVNVEWIVDGIAQPSDLEIPATITVKVPLGVSTYVVEAIAKDDEGAKSTDTATITVKIGSPPKTGSVPVAVIISPEKSEAEITEGDAITLKGKAESESEKGIASAEFTVDGKSYLATLIDGVWVAEVTLPVGPGASSEISSSVLPHVFVGTATIDRVPATDGTVISASVVGGDSSTSLVSFTATDDFGTSAPDSLKITVLAKQVQIGTAVVISGAYTLVANQMVGKSYSGKTVSFRTGDRVADQSGTWTSGGADELNLTWDSPK